MRPNPDEVPHIEAMRASVDAGFRFLHMRAPDGGAVAAILAERHHDGAVDTYAVESHDKAVAARYLAAEYADRADADPVWAATGDVSTVVRALLDLPPHSDPAAPRRTQLPSDFWLPGGRQ